jgi:hypothetical protein
MPPIPEFLIAALATYRISLLFTTESGPARIFAKLRRAPKRNSGVADWLSCIFCFSLTASAVVCGLWWLAGLRQHWALWFILWCALSAAALAIHRTFTRTM